MEVNNIKKGIILLALLFLVVIPYVSAENVTIDNTMSIQDAVNNVNDNDTIFLSPGTYTESGIKIDKNITLQGLGSAEDIIIDGDNKNTIILVNSVSKVKFFNLTFINGKSPDFGGAIHSELGGEIYVDSCNFINNSARQNGGAIDIAGEQHRIKWQVFTNYGFLNATNCKFINNQAGHDGGAIATYWGNSYIYNSLFRLNYAERDGGSVRVGIYSTTLTENCTFDNNTAKEWGGALYNWPGQLTVNNCTISNNKAGTQGGALITSGGLIVTNSVIVNNTATRKGGVLYISEETPHIPSTVIFENNYISGNTAKVGSLVYTDETTATGTNFDNNYWDINPDSDNWENAFITNGLIDNPTSYIDESGNIHNVTPKEKSTIENNTHVPEEKPNHNSDSEINEDTNQTIPENTKVSESVETNNTNTQNQQLEEIIEAIEELIDETNIQSNTTSQSNVGLNNYAENQVTQNQESQAGASDENSAHEIVRKNVTKQANQSPIPYIVTVIVVLAILIIGYTRRKNE